MDSIIAVLLKIAAIGILLVTIVVICWLPFFVRALVREMRKRRVEMDSFEKEHKERAERIRQRGGLA